MLYIRSSSRNLQFLSEQIIAEMRHSKPNFEEFLLDIGWGKNTHTVNNRDVKSVVENLFAGNNRVPGSNENI